MTQRKLKKLKVEKEPALLDWVRLKHVFYFVAAAGTLGLLVSSSDILDLGKTGNSSRDLGAEQRSNGPYPMATISPKQDKKSKISSTLVVKKIHIGDFVPSADGRLPEFFASIDVQDDNGTVTTLRKKISSDVLDLTHQDALRQVVRIISSKAIILDPSVLNNMEEISKIYNLRVQLGNRPEPGSQRQPEQELLLS